MFKSFFHCTIGLLAAIALVIYAPIAACLTLLAMPLAALADNLTSWTIRLLSRDSPAPSFSVPSSIAFPAPQTGRPEVTAFA